MPTCSAGGREWPGLRIMLDATLVTAHSEKEQAAATFKGGYGFHPLTAWLDNTGEALAGVLRPGNAGANTATDHIEVVDLALAQLPDLHRHGTPILVSADGAGGTLPSDSTAGVQARSGRARIAACTAAVIVNPTVKRRSTPWSRRLRRWPSQAFPRPGADVAELTGLLPGLTRQGWPAGMRVIVRRERPHPGAQLTFTDHNGWRFQAFATDTPAGQLAHLEARHRAHARVEDYIRCAKGTGLGRLPSRQYAINQVWLELALAAADLLAWARSTLLDGELAVAEPKALRYRVLHVAARLTRGHRRTYLRIDARWPWREPLARAFTRLHALPLPAT